MLTGHVLDEPRDLKETVCLKGRRGEFGQAKLDLPN